MTVLHATEPATVYLSLLARVDGLTVADVDRALYDDRTLVKQLAMRRTLFVFPRDLLPAAWGSASARVAGQLRPRLAKEVEAGRARRRRRAPGSTRRARPCSPGSPTAASSERAGAPRARCPSSPAASTIAPGKAYGANVPIAPRVLTQLGVEGQIVRGTQRRALAASPARSGR